MRPVRVTLSSATSSAPIPIDTYRDPVNISLGVTLSVGASLTYTVEYTLDDVFSSTFSAAVAAWYPVVGLSGLTASGTGNLAFPVTAVRFRVSVYTSGTAACTLIQAGLRGS
jgi:hypothetical protein